MNETANVFSAGPHMLQIEPGRATAGVPWGKQIQQGAARTFPMRCTVTRSRLTPWNEWLSFSLLHLMWW